MTKVTEYFAETNETIERELTSDEQKDLQTRQEKSAKILQTQTEILEKRQAAEAKLAALGLTAEDLKALGLG